MTIIVAAKTNQTTYLASDTSTFLEYNTWGEDQNYLAKKFVIIPEIGIVAGCGYCIYDILLKKFIEQKKSECRDNKSDLLKHIDFGTDIGIFDFFKSFLKYLKTEEFWQSQSKDRFPEFDSTFLIVNLKGEIFTVTTECSVTHFKRYHAIGAGQSIAMGSLFSLFNLDSIFGNGAHTDSLEKNLDKIVLHAAQSACAFHTYCGGSLNLVKIENGIISEIQ